MIKTKSIQKTVVALLIAVALFGCAKSGNNLPATEKIRSRNRLMTTKTLLSPAVQKQRLLPITVKRPHRLPMQKAVTKVPPTQP